MSELVIAGKAAPWILILVALGMAESDSRPITTFLIALIISFVISAAVSLTYDWHRQRRRERER